MLGGWRRVEFQMQIGFASVGYVHFIAAFICAMWAMELGFSQLSQTAMGDRRLRRGTTDPADSVRPIGP